MTAYTFNGRANVILDGLGYGFVRIAPSTESWLLNRITVNASGPGGVGVRVKESTCNVYRMQIGPTYLVDSTFTGSSGDTSDTTHDLRPGDCLFIEWTNGDAGALAVLTYGG